MFQLKKEADEVLINIVQAQKSELKAREIPVTDRLSRVFRQMALILLENNSAFFTTDNKVKLYTDGKDKFNDLIRQSKKRRTLYISNTISGEMTGSVMSCEKHSPSVHVRG